MAYRMRYTISMDWVGPGMGPMGAGGGALQGQNGTTGPGQTREFFNTAGGQNLQGSGAGTILAAADITTLTNAMAADIAAQMNAAAALAQMQGWATGGA